MENSSTTKNNSRKDSRRSSHSHKLLSKRQSAFMKTLHIGSSVLLGLVLAFLFLFYGGEFQLAANNRTVLLTVAALLIANAAYFSLRNRLEVVVHPKMKIFRILKKALLVAVNGWNLVLAAALVCSYILLLLKTPGLFEGAMSLLYLVTAVPFAGYAFLFGADSLLFFYGVVKKKAYSYSMKKGAISAGILFLAATIAVGKNISANKPVWAEEVSHKALFTAGEQPGRAYRIPSMLVFQNRTILAFCESRDKVFSDAGDIDLVMKKSTDGGRSWSGLVTLIDDGKNTAGNPCPVFDSATGTIFLLYCINNQSVYIISSADYGATWSAPRDITAQLNLGISPKSKGVDMIYGTGPGIGIRLENSGVYNGRLVVPAYYFNGGGAHVIYSDDNGKTWEKGGNVAGASSEAQAFETLDGRLYLTVRNDKGGLRYKTWSSDGGKTFTPAGLAEGLPDPGCMSSVIRYSSKNSMDKNIVMFSSPGEKSRGNMTVRLSYNEGATWEYARQVYSGPSAYSQLGVLPEGTICLLLEAGKYDYRESIQFAQFPLSFPLEGKIKK